MKKTLLASLTFFALITLILSGCKGGSTPTTSQSTTEGATLTSTDVHSTSAAVTTVPITTTKVKEPTMGNPLYAEMWRPAYHYTAKKSWLNDPNGLTYFDGLYHIYYQTNPGNNVGGNEHWGHATSTDLIHWEEQKPALAPDSTGRIWSGTSYVDSENRSGFFKSEKGGIIAAYSTHTQKIGIAYSEDGFTFKKIGIVIDNNTYADFRDPKLFFDDISGKWTMVVAGGKVRFYQSSDLKNWTLVSENEIYTECPDFFPLKIEGTDTEMWVLTCAGRHAFVGEWDGTKFTPRSSQIPLNYGPDSYAGIIFSADRENRTLMLNWLNNWSYTQPADGVWAGANTLVHELTLVKSGSSYRLMQTPVKEYESLYNGTLASLDGYTHNGKNPFAEIDSQTYLLEMTVDVSSKKDFSLHFYDSENERVTLSYDASSRVLSVDRSKSVLGIDAMKTTYSNYSCTLSSSLMSDGMLDIKVYLDTSSIEVYALDHTYVMTLRTQPMTSSRGLRLEAESGLVIDSARVTELKNIHFEDSESIDAVHTSTEAVTITADSSDGVFRSVTSFGGKKPFTAESTKPEIATVEIVDGGIIIKGISKGSAKIKVTVGYTYVYIPVTVLEKSTFSSEIENFSTTGGTLYKNLDGYLLKSSGGDAFALSDVFAADLEFSADVYFPKNSGGAALVFRATDVKNFYCLCLDRSNGVVKIWNKKNGEVKDLKTVSYSFSAGKTYTVKIVAAGNTMIGYINGKEVISLVDDRHSEGVLGINAFATDVRFNNITYKTQTEVNINSMIDSYDVIFGNLGKTDKGFLFSNSSGDGFAVSSVTASDFSYKTTLTVNQGTPAGALLFRMKDVSNFYCATVDVGANIIKLWMKSSGDVHVLKTVSLSLAWDTPYEVEVRAEGNLISILVNGKEVLTHTDNTHSSGYLGINVFNGSAYFNNIEYTIVKK